MTGAKIHSAVTIVGAGLAGSLLAIYLARRGFRVRVFERRPDMRTVEIPAGRSINLALANRGIRALAEVGLKQQVGRLLIPMRGRMLHDLDGTLSFQPYGKDASEVIYSVPRGGLNELLMTQAEKYPEVSFHFNHRCAPVDLQAGVLEVTDKEDDSTYRLEAAPMFVAAGATSRIRRKLAELPGFSATEEELAHDYKELTIPAAADGSHRIERNALHIWPRGEYMLIALPNLDGSFTVTLFLPRTGPESFAALDDAAAVEQFFARVFPDAQALIPSLTEDFFARPTGKMMTVRCLPWHLEDKLVLLGDAAHSIVPFHGQGMNAAFEDCREMGRCIDEHGADWQRVFAAFERDRKPNADAIADMALDNYLVMRERVRDPKFHLQKKLEWELEKRYPDLFIARYSMVMFHHIPYAEALERGNVQASILNRLTEHAAELSEVDFDLAERLVRGELEARAKTVRGAPS